MWMIPFLISCQNNKNTPPVIVSTYLLEDCPIPKRTRYRNDYLRDYTIELYKSLVKCNADKRAIKKELGL